MIQGKICLQSVIFKRSKTFWGKFQENILEGAISIYNRYSEQPVGNLTKRRTLPPAFC